MISHYNWAIGTDNNMLADYSSISDIEKNAFADKALTCYRNPIFISGSGGKLLWHNVEFQEFASKYMSGKSVQQVADIIINRKGIAEQNDRATGFSLASKAAENSPPTDFWVNLSRLMAGEGAELNVCQISKTPSASRVNADRNYSLAAVINQIGRKLDMSYRLDETLKIILIGATAGEGLGFNRAFLLLYDSDSGLYKGEIAIGPSDGHEAGAIWSELVGAHKTLDELIDNYNHAAGKYDVKVNNIARRINLPASDLCPALNEVFLTHKPRLVTKGSCQSSGKIGCELFGILGVDSFAAAPLTVEGSIVGLLLADNLITGRNISESDLEILGIFANHAGTAVQRSRMYERLQNKIELLAQANERLKESQKRLIESEKLTAIGKMASDVAHEIRNPLSVAGGYARNVRKKAGEKHEYSEALDIIIKEVDRIEEVLDNFATVSKAAPEERVVFNFSQLVSDVLQMVNSNVVASEPIIDIIEIENNIMVCGSEKQLRNAILAFSKQFINVGGTSIPVGAILKPVGDQASLSFLCKPDDAGKSRIRRVLSNILVSSPLKRETDLVIASEIINQHSGSISIEHGKDRPLSIVINLPIHKE